MNGRSHLNRFPFSWLLSTTRALVRILGQKFVASKLGAIAAARANSGLQTGQERVCTSFWGQLPGGLPASWLGKLDFADAAAAPEARPSKLVSDAEKIFTADSASGL
jgi:hypothetical protein